MAKVTIKQVRKVMGCFTKLPIYTNKYKGVDSQARRVKCYQPETISELSNLINALVALGIQRKDITLTEGTSRGWRPMPGSVIVPAVMC